MPFRLLADLVVLLHLAFIVFVALGGFLTLRWPRIAWLHLPAALWGGLVELGGLVCPLTPLEVWLRRAAGQAGYASGFVEHYILPIVYPGGLTRPIQVLLGVGVIVLNLLAYAVVLPLARRRPRRRSRR